MAEYLQRMKVKELLKEATMALLAQKPSDAKQFLANFFVSKARSIASSTVSEATTPTIASVIGANIQEPTNARASNELEHVAAIDGLVDTLVVFDNKKFLPQPTPPLSPPLAGTQGHPRLGIVQTPQGGCRLITKGDSAFLQAEDLESLSLVETKEESKEKSEDKTYAASTSLGKLFVFKLERTSDGELSIKKIARGQLPVPSSESTTSWREPNRTNIEAMCVTPDGLGGHVISWGARGGKGYAGVPGDRAEVWWRRAPFDPRTAVVDESRMQEGVLRCVGASGWRALSAWSFYGDHVVWSSVYDGEEDGHTLEVDAPRTAAANRAAFKSMLASADLRSGQGQVLAVLEGIKVEAVAISGVNAAGEIKSLFFAGDDEGLGSLAGEIAVDCHQDGGDGTCASNPAYVVDLGKASAELNGVAIKRFGSSGMVVANVTRG